MKRFLIFVIFLIVLISSNSLAEETVGDSVYKIINYEPANYNSNFPLDQEIEITFEPEIDFHHVDAIIRPDNDSNIYGLPCGYTLGLKKNSILFSPGDLKPNTSYTMKLAYGGHFLDGIYRFTTGDRKTIKVLSTKFTKKLLYGDLDKGIEFVFDRYPNARLDIYASITPKDNPSILGLSESISTNAEKKSITVYPQGLENNKTYVISFLVIFRII